MDTERILMEKNENKKTLRRRTGLVYDDRMLEYWCLWDRGCPEQPDRLSCTFRRCEELGLVDRCLKIQARPASRSELELVHSEDLVQLVEKTKDMKDQVKLEDLSSNYFATFFHPKVYDCALLAAGGAVELVTAVLSGKVRNGMALIRPPGHHAMHDEVCGYCFFNNVAISAKAALQDFGLQRILIVDWDVHHGQATQYTFYDDPRVLYFSLHRYQHGTSWPFLRESHFDCTGTGPGVGFNINVPLQEVGLGNEDYLGTFYNLLLPVAYEFAPELVLVSAGFDSALGDAKGLMEVTPAGYSHLLTPLLGLAEGRVCVLLEGGYCLPSLTEGAALCLRTLLGDPTPAIGPLPPPSSSMTTTILDCLSVLRPVWRSLRLQGSFTPNTQLGGRRRPRHTPEVVYKGAELAVRPARFKTHQFYPTLSEVEKMEFHRRLQVLKDTTDLSLPTRGTLILDTRDNSGSEDFTSLLQGDVHLVQEALPDGGYLRTMDSLLSGQIRNAAVVTAGKDRGVVKSIVDHVLSSTEDHKMLLVDWSCDETHQEDPRVLEMSLQSGPVSRGHVAIPVPHVAGDLVAAFLHVVLPVSYQFDPDVVLMNCTVPEKKAAATPEVYRLLVHLLTPLARGRILLVHNGSPRCEVFRHCMFALLQDTCRLPALKPSPRAVEVTQQAVSEAKRFWSCLKFDVDLPTFKSAT